MNQVLVLSGPACNHTYPSDSDDIHSFTLDATMTPSEALNEYLAATGRPHFVFFGPHANCTFELCSTAWSAYGYRPDLGANIALLVTFIVALLAHVVLGVWWRQWYFMACMICGCLDEILGYAARVWMYYDLWSFKAFMIQAGAS